MVKLISSNAETVEVSKEPIKATRAWSTLLSQVKWLLQSPVTWILAAALLFVQLIIYRPPGIVIGGYRPIPSGPTDWWPSQNTAQASNVAETVLHKHMHPQVDETYAHIEREPGNLERVLDGVAPRPVELRRKLGLIAIPAGNKAKPMVDQLVRRFGLRDFSFMIFHWDNATWNEFPWYHQITSVRALSQTKYWFAKRYLTPDVVQAYDYIWLWDDDIAVERSFDPIELTSILKKYHIHFAQPSLTWGEHGPQGQVVRKRESSSVGRFTSFVEVMIPIISRGAWPCAWRMIPWDARATWGVDNVWYPGCGAYGYCRFAVIDSQPVKHMDTRTFDNAFETNLAELDAYTKPFNSLCTKEATSDSESVWGVALHTFCRWWTMRDPVMQFDSVRTIDIHRDAVNYTTCPDPVDFPKTKNLPWWAIR